MSALAFGHNDGSYIRETPASNSPEVAMGNPSGRLAVAGLTGMQMASGGIGTEFLAAKTGLKFLSGFGGQGISLSRNGIGGTY
jgi:hypothetical protein